MYCSDILLDILHTIPTPVVASVVIELIKDGTMSGKRAVLPVTVLSLVLTPTPAIIRSLLVSNR